jgi:hypothetical protein
VFEQWLHPHFRDDSNKFLGFFLRNWRQSDWLASLTWIGIGLIVVIHIACFAAVVLSRNYYGEVFNPIVFAQFEEAKRTGGWNPLQPAIAATLPLPPKAPTTMMSEQTVAPTNAAPTATTNNWMVLTEEERQLVRARKVQMVQNAMREAEKKWLLGQQKSALDTLHQAMNEVPDHTPLVRMLAEYYKESGDLSKAEFFWEKVKLLSDEQSTDWKLASEQIVVVQQAQKKTETPEATRRAVGAGRLRIVKVDEKPASLEDLYDKKFTLEIILSANLTEPTVDHQQTKVEILFFDQYQSATGVLLPKRTLSTFVRPNRSWSSRENESLAVTYSVPRGYWRKNLKIYGKSYDFCGYVVRVYYRGEFQDAAWNRDLLLPWKTPVP